MIKNIGNFKDNSDGTIKSVYDIANNKIIEMSMLYNKVDKDVICVPTHYYCNLGCKMCHLTNSKLNKPMIPIKIDDFLYCIIETLKKYKTNQKKLLISFMGVGEPLLNIRLIDDVFQNEETIKELGYEEISYALSTMMPNDNLKRLKNIVNTLNISLKVHFSLHTPMTAKRKDLIPGSNISICESLELLSDYRKVIKSNDIIMKNYKKFHQTDDPIEIHYTLIQDVNDSNEELTDLINLLKKYKITIKFIKFNPTNDLEISSNEKKWLSQITNSIPNLRVKTYSPPGREIGSSCGEFTKHYYHSEIETNEELEEFNIWKQTHELI